MKTDYKKMYLHLFNAVTDALELMPEKAGEAMGLLMRAQQDCERLYIEMENKEGAAE